MSRPENVLIIMSDEHQARALSCLGHPLVKTPNLDRLAARGTLFENAYTPSPICVPARAALATGRYPHQTGYWCNAIAYDGRVQGWGHMLQQAGVRTTSIGKLHYRSKDDPTGFDEQIAPMHIHEGVGQIWAAVRNPLPDEKRTGRMLGKIGAGCSIYNDYDYRVCSETITWLDKAAATNEPWLLFSSFVAPHFPLTVPQKYLDLYDPATIPLSEVRCENGYELHPWMQRRQEFWNHDGLLRDDNERRLAMACYFALCSFVDARIGGFLMLWKQQGRQTTRWSSTPRTTANASGSATPGESRCFMVRRPCAADHGRPGYRCGRDLRHTGELGRHCADLIRAFWPNAFGGVAGPIPAPHVAGPGKSLGAGVLGISRGGISNRRLHVADADWKYHYYVDYPPELFDLAADPDERENLAGRPEYAKQEARMHARLLEICDPVAIDRAAKSDQDKVVAAWGGREAALRSGVKGASPVPV